MLLDAIDRARAGAEQRDDEVAHLQRHREAVFGLRLEHLLREPRDARIGVRIGRVEVAALTDDAVEIVTELDASPEHPLVD
jgi:hypothetical protein